MVLDRRFAFCFLACFLGLTVQATAAGVVNVYSYREPQLVTPLFEAFTAETGIAVKMVYADKGLIERLQQEGELSPADLLLTADGGRLVEAAAKGLAQAVVEPSIIAHVPAKLRAPDNKWFGLTMRARVIYAARQRVKQDSISYEELADPKWKGKVCTRPGDHPYNLGLIAAMIVKRGESETRKWLQGVKANLAIKPSGNDRSQAKSVAAGECDLAIGNTYYMVAMQKSPEQKSWADAVKMIFPNAEGRGTHVNISGVALAPHAPNASNAMQLIEFLVSNEAQKLYAEADGEYPVVSGVKASDMVESWGPLKADPLPLAKIAELRKKASEMIDRVHFDAGPNS